MSDSESKPVFRRRKKSILGRDWQAPALADKAAGEYCRACKKRHGYNGYQKLSSFYERRGKAWVLLWSCPVTGNVVAEKYLGDKDNTEEGEDGTKPEETKPG